MENLTHTLAGAVLGRAGLNRATPLAAPALLISANLPDVDIAVVLFGGSYLDFHRGITHSILAVPPLALGLAACLWLYGRARRMRAAGPSFLPLFAVCTIGTLSHPMLDLLNDYGLRPWLPLSENRLYGDMVSIVDPWMWIVLGFAVCLTASSLRRKVAWAVLGTFLLSVTMLLGGALLGIVWLLFLALLHGSSRVLRLDETAAARAALFIFALYLAGVAVARQSAALAARAEVAAAVPAEVRRVEILPGRSGGPHRWTVVAETDRRYHLASIGIGGSGAGAPVFESFEKNLADPRYRKALAQPQMETMARFARFPSVDVQEGRGGCTVFLRDLRYARVSRPGWGVARADLPLSDCIPRRKGE